MTAGLVSAGELDETLQGLDELSADNTFTSALQGSRETGVISLSTYKVLACQAGNLPPPTVQETSRKIRGPPVSTGGTVPCATPKPGGWTVEVELQDHMDRYRKFSNRVAGRQDSYEVHDGLECPVAGSGLRCESAFAT
jgi:hypothetical protein